MFFSVLVLSVFQFWRFLLTCTLAQIPFLSCARPLISPSNAFFVSVTGFLMSNISFWFFLGISISLLLSPICSYLVSTSSIGVSSILISIVLNFWLVILTPLPCLVLMLALFLQIVLCLFFAFQCAFCFLMAGYDTLVNRNCDK